MFNKTRILVINYNNCLKQSEIPLFRGAVISSVGEDNISVLFHNHIGETVSYSYPKIQYKRIHNAASIVCINEGADVIGQFLSSLSAPIKIGNREELMVINNIKASQCLVKTWGDQFRYHLRKWLPFNQENYKAYNNLQGIAEKITFLEKILIGNLLSFAKGIGVTIDSKISCVIESCEQPVLLKYKGVKMMSFDLVFKSNISLPNFIGIGKGVSLGFGVVTEIPKRIINDKNLK